MDSKIPQTSIAYDFMSKSGEDLGIVWNKELKKFLKIKFTPKGKLAPAELLSEEKEKIGFIDAPFVMRWLVSGTLSKIPLLYMDELKTGNVEIKKNPALGDFRHTELYFNGLLIGYIIEGYGNDSQWKEVKTGRRCIDW